jgi:hypothetical protein
MSSRSIGISTIANTYPRSCLQDSGPFDPVSRRPMCPQTRGIMEIMSQTTQPRATHSSRNMYIFMVNARREIRFLISLVQQLIRTRFSDLKTISRRSDHTHIFIFFKVVTALKPPQEVDPSMPGLFVHVIWPHYVSNFLAKSNCGLLTFMRQSLDSLLVV